jgi:hypothetical protein
MKASYKITGMVIHVACSDGKLREVSLSPTAAMVVGKTLRHASGGTLKLYPAPVRVVADENWLIRKLHSLGRKETKKA